MDSQSLGLQGPNQSEQKLKRSQYAAYGLSDFGFNLFWTTAGFYILYFYTDVLGLSGKTAGLIFLIAMLWDAITDPIMGYFAQRTRTRWGSYRPYLLLGSFPLAASLVLLFFDPGLDGAALVVFALVAHMAFRTAYTVVNIPYSSLSARLTRSSENRSRLAAWRISLATLGSAFVAYSTLRLVTYFGDGNAAAGFVVTAALYGLLSLPIFLSAFTVLREPKEYACEQSSVSMKAAISVILKNKPFFVIMFATIFATLGGVLASKLIVYYFKYTLMNQEAVGNLFATNSIVILLSAPLLTLLAAKTSKRRVWQLGAVISITSSLLLFLNQFETVTAVVAIGALGAIGSAAGYLTFWSALPDTVEYGEMRSGRREESLTFGIMSFVQKASYGFGAALAGFILDWIGYSASGPQSPATLEALKIAMTLLPASFILVALFIIGKYRLDRHTHERVLRVIEERRRRFPQNQKLVEIHGGGPATPELKNPAHPIA